MILAARALGLDCGPMSGFDNAKLDEEFFAAGKCESCEQEFFPEGHVKSNFLCNIGYGDPATLMPRGALGSTLAKHAPCCDRALLAVADSAA
jgi:3-hydroxypropanoate dehydrogenase